MEIIIICAQCSNEYKADASVRFWKCSHCGRESENGKYPFLTRKIAHAKAHRSEADWEAMFDELLSDARERVITLENKLRRLEAERAPPKRPGEAQPGP